MNEAGDFERWRTTGDGGILDGIKEIRYVTSPREFFEEFK